MESFGDRLKKRREELRLSTRAVAAELEISHVAVGKLESGLSKSPSADNLFRLANFLRLDPQQLLYGEERYSLAGRSAVMQIAEAAPSELDQLRNRFDRLPSADRQQLVRLVKSFIEGCEERDQQERKHTG